MSGNCKRELLSVANCKLQFAIWGALPAIALLAVGCGPARPVPKTEPAAQRAPVRFEDVTASAGITFRHTTGAEGRKWMPETMGAGCAWMDVDNDGWLDLVLVDSTPWPGSPLPPGRCRLYRNRKDGTFADVSREYNMPVGIYGMGVTAGDVDNDGFCDLVLTALGGSRLLRNVNGRRFEDVTKRWGLATPGWPTSAALLDYDRDGRLDLFVCHYVKWTPESDVFASLDGVRKSYARPDNYSGEPCQLFRNRRGRFEDVSARVGIGLANSKALGVALCDFDRDGWVDLAVSNDMVPNFLFHNQGERATFKEVAVQAGMAVAEGGIAKAGMGIDVADYENAGRDGVLITNFTGEQLSLYRRDPSGLFTDVAARAGIGTPSQQFLGFGAFFFDADLDGNQDILVANGHIQDDIEVRSSGVTHAQPGLFFRGLGEGRFEPVGDEIGALREPRVARGAAYGDYDNDGDLDVLLSANGGPPALLRQAGRPAHHWLRLRLEGRRGNRSAIGAGVRVRSGGTDQYRMVRGGSSYLSQSDLRLTFGLGQHTTVEEIEVRWPSGAVESFPGPQPDREVVLIEGEGKGQ